MLNDIRFALRGLRATPLFTALAVVTLAIGIGANAAVFTLVDNIFLRGMDVERPEQIRRLFAEAPERGVNQFPWSEAKFRFFRERQTTFQSFAADTFAAFTMTGTGDPEVLNGQRVTSGLFPMLGIRPVMGRLFHAEEEEAGPDVVIITETFWATRLTRDPAVIGRTLTLNGRAFEIVGVVADPPATLFGASEIWATRPFAFPGYTEELRARGVGFLRVWGRVADDVSVEQVRTHVVDLTRQYRHHHPEKVDAPMTNTLQSLDEATVANLRPAFLMLLGAVALVLLIAASNVANLLLVRFASRRREVAVRLALGSARGRVVRLFLLESLTVSGLALLLGLLIARVALVTFTDLLDGVPVSGELALNRTVLTFTILVAALTGLLTGLYPAMQAARPAVVDALKEGGRSSTISRSQHRFRMWMVGGQVAVSSVLLVGAMLLLSSFANLHSVDLGFESDGLLVAAVPLPEGRYPDAMQQQLLIDQFMESLRTRPGIANATAAIGIPMTGFGVQGPLSRTDPETPFNERPIGTFRFISDQYLETLDTRVVDGRTFDGSDWAHPTRSILVSEMVARQFFPNERAVGRFLLAGSRGGGERVEIIGVVRDLQSVSLTDPPVLEVYRPFSQRLAAGGFFQLLVRSASPDALATLPIVRAALTDLDPNLPLVQPQSMDDLVGGAVAQQRLLLALLGTFAGLAVALAVIGLYSVLAFLVGQRANEIGVRLALGAQRGQVTRLIWRQGMVPVVAGVAFGLVVAAASGRLVESHLFGTTATDPTSYLITGTSLLSAAAIACLIPAWRAARRHISLGA